MRFALRMVLAAALTASVFLALGRASSQFGRDLTAVAVAPPSRPSPPSIGPAADGGVAMLEGARR